MYFHNAILDAAGSRRVAELVRKVIELPLVYRSYIWYSVDAAAHLRALPPPDHDGARGSATASARSW